MRQYLFRQYAKFVLWALTPLYYVDGLWTYRYKLVEWIQKGVEDGRRQSEGAKRVRKLLDTPTQS